MMTMTDEVTGGESGGGGGLLQPVHPMLHNLFVFLSFNRK